MTRLSDIAKQLLLVADQTRDTDYLTLEVQQSAGRLLWRAYECGAFPNDEVFTYSIQRYRRECAQQGDKPNGEGFADFTIHYWLQIRDPGVQCSCETGGGEEDRQAFEHAIRQIARRILAEEKAGESLTLPILESVDVKLLRTLAGQPGVVLSQYELVEAADCDRKTVGLRLRHLRTIGYVTPPDGRKRGNTITPEGVARLQTIAKTSP